MKEKVKEPCARLRVYSAYDRMGGRLVSLDRLDDLV